MKVLRFKFIENCDSKYYGVSTLVNFQSPGIINNPFSFCYKVWLIYTKKMNIVQIIAIWLKMCRKKLFERCG